MNANYKILNGNQAAAQIAYKTNEVCVIYPITPSSEMSELVEAWSADFQKNVYGGLPSVFEMQSEAGVAGALHGALQTGAVATTFTASQGLLLMMPNMFKIAGELTPNVIHVATRSVATHALSVFSDHSDIMAVRNTGYAFLGGGSVQEAMDFALIAQAATLKSRVPFVHFFDGFRISHETSKIEPIADEVIRSMVDIDLLNTHRNRKLTPDKPVVRGTSQGPEVYFQSREAVNNYYADCPEIVQDCMDEFADLTGRQYHLFEYVGHQHAEHLIITMGSSTETVEETINNLNFMGERIGLIKVKLFRPFSTDHLIKCIPVTCRSIAVLDRTKEPSGVGEPLYLDVAHAVLQHCDKFEIPPKVLNGRYGLSSKAFTPAMVVAIINNLKEDTPKSNFTVGINDDITQLSLPVPVVPQVPFKGKEVLFYESKKDNSMSNFDYIMKLMADQYYVQAYTEIDYNKSNVRKVTNFRISDTRIKAPYLISKADFVACDSVTFVTDDNAIERLGKHGKLLVNTDLGTQEFWKILPSAIRREIQNNEVAVYLIDLATEGKSLNPESHLHPTLPNCFLALENDLLESCSALYLKNAIKRLYPSHFCNNSEIPIELDDEFSDSFLGKLLKGKGNEIAVSELSPDGTFQSDTSKYYSKKPTEFIPDWNTSLCTQCGACSMACPQAAIRMKAFDDTYAKNSPANFKRTTTKNNSWQTELVNFTIQIDPKHCTGCENCVDACPSNALSMKKAVCFETAEENWRYFESMPEVDRSLIDVRNMGQQQFQEPLFKYALGVDGCGEAPYLKLLSQLFGDRLLVANATGSSSIFGGAMPVTPWSKNSKGLGPAWSNSLFEDNAEFGLGFRLTLDQQRHYAKILMKALASKLNPDLVRDILKAPQDSESNIKLQRERITYLKTVLKSLGSNHARSLYQVADSLVKKSVWIVGGDGWAYDIGYGGIDHVIASGQNVNILVLDNEVYANTGGQMSKATPAGASALFSTKGKTRQKKDLGLLAMTYDNVYVAQVAIGANKEQTLKAFVEAESFDGPSIIIAYCHSVAHGINMKKPSLHHKLAVDTGHWMLFRNDPRKLAEGLNTFQLDSKKTRIPLVNYLRSEKRFNRVFIGSQDEVDMRIETLQTGLDRRLAKYLAMAVPRQSTQVAHNNSPEKPYHSCSQDVLNHKEPSSYKPSCSPRFEKGDSLAVML